MSTAVCLGGGEIGRQGIRCLLEEGARVLLVDPNENCLARSLCQGTVDTPDQVLDHEDGKALYLKGDGSDVLADIMLRWIPDEVIPAAPGHLAAHLAMAWSSKRYRNLHPFGGPLLRAVDVLPTGTVQFIDSVNGIMMASHMPSGTDCQEDCEQPSICPVTGKGPLTPMNKLIERALAETVDRHSILVTHGRKVGKIRGDTIKDMLEVIDRAGEGTIIGIATSCRCHAIANIFRCDGP
ncbi:MAG TPA: hypothetical protein PKI40_08030 [Methanomassiliicoccaceae archaeon]|nr:hypothetical protein [Methanomassiliicoccaceae archaeon]